MTDTGPAELETPLGQQQACGVELQIASVRRLCATFHLPGASRVCEMEWMSELAIDRSSRSNSSDPLVEGFRAVYEAEVARLVRLAHLITGSNAAAEDLVHDAFLAAFDRWDSIDDPHGYMYRAVVNRSRSFLRRRRYELTRRPESSGVALPPEIDEMWTALARISPRRRTALVLRYYADLPIDEIADLMNARPGTVRSLIHRGHESLRKVLDS